MNDNLNVNSYIANKIKYYRNLKGFSQEDVANKLGIAANTISRYETGERGIDQNTLFALSQIYGVSTNAFFPPYDNATNYTEDEGTVEIDVLGTIKAGIPVEAQQYKIDTVGIPKRWLRGGKKFFALKVSGDSMSPNYNDGDIIILEQNGDHFKCNNKDCAVMVNNNDATFKHVKIDNNGITLVPHNLKYDIKHYDVEQVIDLPVIILGYVVRRVEDINDPIKD